MSLHNIILGQEQECSFRHPTTSTAKWSTVTYATKHLSSYYQEVHAALSAIKTAKMADLAA